MPTVGRAYRGPERRRQAPPPSLAGHFLLGGLLLLSVAALFAVMGARGVELPADQAGHVNDLVRTGTMVLAGAVATLCLVRWRLGSETAVLFVGTAILVFGGVVVGVSSVVVPLLRPDDVDAPLLVATRAGGLVVVLGLIVLALAAHEVDTGLRAWRVAGLALALTGLLAAVLHRLPAVAEFLAFGRRFPLGATAPSTAGRLALGAVWAALALLLCARGLRQGRTMFAWTGLMLLALALSELMALDVNVATDVRLLGSEVLQLLALGLLLVGVVSDFQRNFIDQRARLYDSLVAMRAVQAQARVGSLVRGRRRHDLANAMMGLEGAASTLEKYYDQLEEDDRRRLAAMVAASVERLRGLSADDGADVQPVALATTSERLVDVLRDAGCEVDVDVPAEVRVRAVPDEVAEILGQVGRAVVDERPDGPVRLVGVRYGDAAWLSVEFRPAQGTRAAPGASGAAPAAGPAGPSGTPPAGGNASPVRRLRRRVTPRAAPALGRGMDLSVAAHLVKERGGQLIAEPVGDDGVAIRLQLPAAVDGQAASGDH